MFGCPISVPSLLKIKCISSHLPLVICYIAIENGHLEIVDLPIKNGDFPVRYVHLPEGSWI